MSSYRDGQFSGIESAMTALCPHCLRAVADGGSLIRGQLWYKGTIQSAGHLAAGAVGGRRKCRASRLIPLLLMVDSMRSHGPWVGSEKSRGPLGID